MNKCILQRKVRRVKGGELGDEFTSGQVYDVEIGGVVMDNLGDPYFINTDNDYKFEEIAKDES